MSVVLFYFEFNEIRFVGTSENPAWIAADICKALEIVNTSDALSRLDEDEKGIVLTDDGSLTGSQMLTVNEFGLNRLVMTSRKPIAKKFQRWVLHEVIPAIRKTGSYSVKLADQSSQDALLAKDIYTLAAQAIEDSLGAIGLKPQLIATLKLNVAEQITPELKPYLLETRQHLICDTAQPHLLLTATEIGKRLNISAQAVNKKLQELGLQAKNANKKSKKDCAYVPCGQGHEFSDLTLASGLGKDQTTYQQLRWYESILTLLS